MTTRDVTQRKRAEEAKAHLEAQLRQAQKMEALGTLAGGIAHDFNNILGAIVGYTELAQADAKDRPDILESLNEVSRAGGRAKDLVKQILAFSRQSKQEIQAVRVQLVVKECVKLLRATLPSTLEMTSELQEEPLVVLADPTQIHQVMMNLCTNAAHAMRGKPGRLSIGLERAVVDGAFASEHPELRTGVYARLTVSDTGCGMDPVTPGPHFRPILHHQGTGRGDRTRFGGGAWDCP